MDITVKGLRHPHRYVLDAAQTHIYMLMKKVGGPCAGWSGNGKPGAGTGSREPEAPPVSGTWTSLQIGEQREMLCGFCSAGAGVQDGQRSLPPSLVRNLPGLPVSAAGLWGGKGETIDRCCVCPYGLSLFDGGPGTLAIGDESVAGIAVIYRGLGSSSHGAKPGTLYQGPPMGQDRLVQSRLSRVSSEVESTVKLSACLRRPTSSSLP